MFLTPVCASTSSPGRPRPRSARRPTALAGVVMIILIMIATSACGGRPDPESVTTPLPAQPRVLIFGDSYTAGAGATPNTKGYAYLVGDQLGWQVTVDGVGGTGYLAPAPSNQGPFLKRLPKAAPGPFDLIILQGSSNDERQSLPDLAPAIDKTVSAFQAKYPGTRIILLGPIALYGSVPEPKAEVNDTLKAYAAAHQLSFIDAIGESWFAPGESKTMANPVDGHPSNEGHLRIRDRLIIDLVRLTATRQQG